MSAPAAQSYTYKTRAECRVDVDRALYWLTCRGHTPSFSNIEMTGFKGQEIYVLTPDESEKMIALHEQIGENEISDEDLKQRISEILGPDVCVLPDVDWTFTCELDYQTLTEMLLNIEIIEDLHVLIEALKPIDKYDGERDNPFAV